MDREIPRAPEHVNVGGVPPIAIKIAIGKLEDFSKQIKVRVKTEVEPGHPQ